MTTGDQKKYRSQGGSMDKLIAFSISYDRDNLLARGYGIEHLKELLIGLARPLLRQGASLMYGGDWTEREGNFTYALLELIKAEKEDNSLSGPDSSRPIGILYNHSAWPDYSRISPEIEARWIDCCHVVRVTQEDAGLRADKGEILEGFENDGSDRFLFNRALALSAMRRMMMEGCPVSLPELGYEAKIPGQAARILLGGKVEGFQGMLPGLFEEAMLCLEHRAACGHDDRPLYILGGFGGAAEVLAKALLEAPGTKTPELGFDYHSKATPMVARLAKIAENLRVPSGKSVPDLYEDVFQAIDSARGRLMDAFRNGLDEADNHKLLLSRDMNEVKRLVRTGLEAVFGLRKLPS